MAETSYTSAPLGPLRKIIARRMADAKRTIPHYRVLCDIQMDRTIELRAALQNQPGQPPISLNDLIIKCCAGALVEHPEVNAQWAETEVRRYHSADISIVTAIDGGISTPIVRDADRKSVWEIAEEVRELTGRAARGGLRMEEIAGGSFSISNLGMYGVIEFDAIINAPQCAILAVGCMEPRLVVSSDGQSRVARLMRVALSVDHRAIDGVDAARFLSTLKSRFEAPESSTFVS